MKKQIELAQIAGLFGFCFYYYNFSGQRLLERPLDAFVADSTINFPFCIMWANENWSRRWDGLDQEILIGQKYRHEDDDQLVDDVARYMKDRRYIRIAERPVFFLYRPDVIPNTPAAVARLRLRFKTKHNLDPIIVMAQGFGNVDPRTAGFDGAVEFPPHKLTSAIDQINPTLNILDPDFAGAVYNYDDLIDASLKDFPSDFPLIKTVVPSWDNDARKQSQGLCFHGSTPAKFQSWIEGINRKIEDHRFFGEKVVMVNAWNEWCEGAYLEPDVHYGFAYLNALSRALDHHPERGARKILLVGHDAHPHGAQMLLLNIGRSMKMALGVEVEFLLMEGGPMVEKYQSLAPTFVADRATDRPGLRAKVTELRAKGFSSAITNSAYSGHCVELLADNGFKVTSLIHELKTIIERGGGIDRYKAILNRSANVVFPNTYVRDELAGAFGDPSGQQIVMAQGLYKDVPIDSGAKDSIRNMLKLPPGSKIVLNTGYADLRKGVDLFVGLARETSKIDPNIHFVWVGGVERAVETWILDDVRRGRVVTSTSLPLPMILDR